MTDKICGIRWRRILAGVLLLMIAILGCSSDPITDSEYSLSPDASDRCVLKVVVSTNANSPQPATPIEFELPENVAVFLEVTNATGYHIATLMDGILETGVYMVTWDGTDDNGEQLQPGIYLYHLKWSGGQSWRPIPYELTPDNLSDLEEY
jgi:hypothetical protein